MASEELSQPVVDEALAAYGVPPAPPKRTFPSVVLFFVVALIVVAGALFASIFFQKKYLHSGDVVGGPLKLPTTAEYNITPYPTQPITVSPEPTATSSAQLSYVSKVYGFSFQYPESTKINDTSENVLGVTQKHQGKVAVSITKVGADQKGQTELYDGYAIQIAVIPTQGDKVEDIALQAVNEHKDAFGQDSLILPISPTTVGGKVGVLYSMRGQGDFTQYMVQKDEANFYLINYFVADTYNRGYKDEVQRILDSLKL